MQDTHTHTAGSCLAMMWLIVEVQGLYTEEHVNKVVITSVKTLLRRCVTTLTVLKAIPDLWNTKEAAEAWKISISLCR